MSTMTVADALAKLKELQAKADRMEQQHNEQMGLLLAQIRDTANIASGSFQVHDGNGAAKPTVRKRGRPKGSKNVKKKKTVVATAAPKKRGRPKGSKNVAKKRGRPKGSKNVKTTMASDKKETPLREIVWEILSRSPRKWKEHIPDLPRGAKGLKVTEISTIINNEGSWKKPTKVRTQIPNHIATFRKEKKVVRGDHARYEIVKGAKL